MLKFVVFAVFIAGGKDLFHTTPLHFTDRLSVFFTNKIDIKRSVHLLTILRKSCHCLFPQDTGAAGPPSPLCCPEWLEERMLSLTAGPGR